MADDEEQPGSARDKPSAAVGSVQRTTLLGDLVLPPAARARILGYAPECLVVIPDGPLHKLPLEALLVSVDSGGAVRPR